MNGLAEERESGEQRGGVTFEQVELYRDWPELPNRSWSIPTCASKPEAGLIGLERSSSKD
jgi:hypothetical protein